MANSSPETTQEASVLLVDDRDDNLLALQAVLEPLGLRTIPTSSGPEALHTLLHDQVDAMILDVQMPGMDGFETARLARSRIATKAIPIVFLTAIDRDRKRELRGYELGAVDYICKPFEPEVLRAKIRSLVGLSPDGRDAAKSHYASGTRHERRLHRRAAPLHTHAFFGGCARVTDVTLPCDLASVALARFHVRQALEFLPKETTADVVLIVSELVANVVVHARSAPTVHLDLGPGLVRGEVFDNSSEAVMPHVSDLPVRGLDLVEKLASRCGWTRLDGGKVLWFELDLPPT